MALTTVLLAELPRLLEELVASALQPHPEVQVISSAVPAGDLLAAARAAGAQAVVVTRSDPADLAAVDPHLAEAARIVVLVLAKDGAWACRHALQDEATRLDDLSSAELLTALAAPPQGAA